MNIQINKVKMKRIKRTTVLATGDQVYMKQYNLVCTLLDELTDGFVICIDHSHSYTYITRKALENHFLKI